MHYARNQDIVTRLRSASDLNGLAWQNLCEDAASCIGKLRAENKNLKNELNQIDSAYEDVSTRLKSIIQRNMRITKLLRAALPEEKQIGSGLEDMVQSLLAAAALRSTLSLED